MKKTLRTRDVFSIATGAMIGSGFFLLPGIAYALAGPAVVVAYLIASVLMVPTLLSNAELATAMPRSGGSYFFASRSMGPMMGVIDGISGWLAMLAKSAFALVGIGFYVLMATYGDHTEASADIVMTVRIVAVAIAVVLAVVNAFGAKESAVFQTSLVVGLVALSVYFIGHGSFHVEAIRFAGFGEKGTRAILATSGLVFVSYAGLNKVASVAEEVRDPEKTIPRGMLLSLGVATAIYVVGIFVVVGVVPADELASDRTPLATAAGLFAGRAGMWAMVVAGCLAFVTTANAGIMSSSRYLYAMGRDKVLPRAFGRLSGRETPLWGIALSTVAVVAVVLFLDAEGIAKLASTIMLVDFAVVNLAVIVMRESRTSSYDSGFRSPLYPWVQVGGVLVSLVLIPLMGWMSAVFALSLVAAGLVWYAAYARGRAEHAVAIKRVLERIAAEILSREKAGPALDRELRNEMKQKGLRAGDPFAEVVASAHVVDLPADAEWDDLMHEAVEHFVRSYPNKAEDIHKGLYEASRTGDTPAAQGIALPHVLLDGIEHYELLMARSRSVLHFPGVAPGVTAVFVLLGSKDDPQQHLRMLAAIARRVEESDFLARWEKARDGEHLKRVLLGLPGR
ncbi:MAG: amino acid permease [Planctomycetota bacterium]|jgi:amino acid transporter/mannitol/fructose-specific phosphotransferase system IIA component (Ntr-type)